MYDIENDLNCSIKGYDFIKCNKQNTTFYNNRTGRFIKSTKNGGSYGIWVGSNWLTRSKIEHAEEIEEDATMSEDLKQFLSQF